MKEENKTAFFLTERELSLLLAAKGIHVFQGLPLQHVSFTQQDILQTLLALNKKGLLDGTEEGFQAAPEISACFSILQNAKGVLNLMPQVPEKPQLCCYPGEKVLVMEPSPLRQETFKLWIMTWHELGQWMRSCGRRLRGEYYRIPENTPLWQAELYVSQDEAVLEDQEGREHIPPEEIGQRIKAIIMEMEGKGI